MTTDPIASHLASWRAAESSRMERELAAAAARDACAATMAANLAARMRAEALPVLERAAATIRAGGSPAIVTTGEPPPGIPGPWVIAITLRLECATHPAHPISDLSFIAEVDPAQDLWRVRSHVISQSAAVREAVPDATIIPGAGVLTDFVTHRITTLVKAVFPIQP